MNTYDGAKMVGECSNSELQSLLQAIKSSDVVESRVQLLTKLTELEIHEKTELATLVECLTTFWEDFTCLDVSQCMLNKAIMQVATKYVDSDLSDCSAQFVAFGTQASTWCGKHLKMTLMSAADSQEEEHSVIFFQFLLDFLGLSAAIMLVLTRYPILTGNDSTVIERFILEQLNLTRDVVSESKRINSYGSEILKVAQMVIDGVVKLCTEYSLAVNWDERPQNDESSIDSREVNIRDHVINITKCTIEKLCELGILAATDGGNLVTILNVSWKGVVSLLQLCKGGLAERVRVQDIILTLISFVAEPLRWAATAWSSSLEETVSVTEARRTFLPIKFYLINAVKISSLYPCQAYLIYKEITYCVIMISAFQIFLSFENLLKTASEVFSELLEKTTMDLIASLLNSSEVKLEDKFGLMDWLFIEGCYSNSIPVDSSRCLGIASMTEIFSLNTESLPREKRLQVARVALFQMLLRYSVYLEEDARNQITRKIRWFLDLLVDEEVYCSILGLQIPVPYGAGKTVDVVWQPVFSALLDAIKTFMIVVFPTSGWLELEAFLLENLFHPHFLCQEIIVEQWCFLLRHAETDMVNDIIDKFCSLMKLLASSESVLIPASPLRKIARIICLLLTNGTPSSVDRVYSSTIDDNKSQFSSVIHLALLLEGFPLNLLSVNIRSTAKQKIVTDFFSFIRSSNDRLLSDCSSGLIGIPVFSISASLRSQQVSISDVDMKSLNFLANVIRNFKNPVDKPMKGNYLKLLSETLGIVSNLKHLYKSDEMEEVILELENLFIAGPLASDPILYHSKPYLTLFMGGLGDMEMRESDDCAKSLAVWALYQMLFREQHWALVHLAIAAFGYFAARTSCNQLWRFVPQNAALSYDLVSGTEANEERFMSELKAFLEKENALLTIAPSIEQLELLAKEGMVLKEMVQKLANLNIEADEHEEINVDTQSNKRRKLPDAFNKGVELIQSGMKAIGDSLSQWQQNHIECFEHQDKFMGHLSQLEDAIAHIVRLTGT